MEPSATSHHRYAELERQLLGRGAVSGANRKGFGSTGLWFANKLFGMLYDDRLVLKLPRKRVDELVASGDGENFDPGHGRLMKEWLSLDQASSEAWLPLALEAMEFVSAKR
jgi:TfoX/Sxy family transcriptional regulator of competence genes